MTNPAPLAHQTTIVLPHRERFTASSAGAVAMVVQRLAAGPSRYRALVAGPPVQGARYPGIEFLPVSVPKFLPLSVTQSYAASLVRALAPLPPGLIEVHNKPDVAMWLARCFRHRPVILFLHNDPRTMRGARSPRSRQKLQARLAQVITVSEYLRGCWLEGLAGPAPEVLHNALDLSALPAPVAPQDREKLILFAGRIVPDKAADVFVTACARALPHLPGWRAAMIGTDGFSVDSADSEFIRKLRPLAAAAGIEMRGYQPHAAVLQAMTRAAIVVVPSRWQEPFGMTALEAMACGAALMCSGRGGLAEVAGDASVLVDPDDPDNFSQLVIALANDDRRRAALSAAGRHRAATYFSVTSAVARLDAIRDAALGMV